MTWAYKDKPEMTAQIGEEYTLAGNNNNVLVIPAGLSFAKAIASDPTWSSINRTRDIPTLIGTYLAACTTYAAIYRKSPVGNSFTRDIDAKTANSCNRSPGKQFRNTLRDRKNEWEVWDRA